MYDWKRATEWKRMGASPFHEELLTTLFNHLEKGFNFITRYKSDINFYSLFL